MRSPGLLLAAALALPDAISLANGSPAKHQTAAPSKGTGPSPQPKAGGDCFSLHMRAVNERAQINFDDVLALSTSDEQPGQYDLVGPRADDNAQPGIFHLAQDGTATANTKSGQVTLLWHTEMGWNKGQLNAVYLTSKIADQATVAKVTPNLGKHGAFSIAGAGQNLACINTNGDVEYATGNSKDKKVLTTCIPAEVTAQQADCNSSK